MRIPLIYAIFSTPEKQLIFGDSLPKAALLASCVFLLGLSGCLGEKDELEAVKSIELSEGWQSSMRYGHEWDEKAFMTVEFSNPAVLCNIVVKSGILEQKAPPKVSVVFYKKEFAEEVKEGLMTISATTAFTKTKNYGVWVFPSHTQCDKGSGDEEVLQKVYDALLPFSEEEINWEFLLEHETDVS